MPNPSQGCSPPARAPSLSPTPLLPYPQQYFFGKTRAWMLLLTCLLSLCDVNRVTQHESLVAYKLQARSGLPTKGSGPQQSPSPRLTTKPYIVLNMRVTMDPVCQGKTLHSYRYMRPGALVVCACSRHTPVMTPEHNDRTSDNPPPRKGPFFCLLHTSSQRRAAPALMMISLCCPPPLCAFFSFSPSTAAVFEPTLHACALHRKIYNHPGAHRRACDHGEQHAVLRKAVQHTADHDPEKDLSSARTFRPGKQGVLLNETVMRTCTPSILCF